MSVRTLGRVPDVPNPDKLLIVNKTMVKIRLDAFGDGGCPILYLVIEYRRDVQREYAMVANNVSPLEREYTIRGLDPAARYYIKVTAHNSAGSSIAEYPFATLTAIGGTIPPPVSTARETSLSYPLLVAVKVLTTVFFSACLIVAAFYLSHLLRKWKLKRDHGLHYHSHHVFFGNGNGSPMFDSLGRNANENPTSQGFRGIRFNRRRRRIRTPQSPVLPPFKSSDTICTAAGGPPIQGSSSSFAPQETWNKDICPYATFQLPPATHRNEIKLQHHGQLESTKIEDDLAYHSGFIDPLFSTTTETFKIKPVSDF